MIGGVFACLYSRYGARKACTANTWSFHVGLFCSKVKWITAHQERMLLNLNKPSTNDHHTGFCRKRSEKIPKFSAFRKYFR